MIQSDTRVANWKPITRPYEETSVWKGIWQIVNTFGPYILLWVVMYHGRAVSWWLIPLLAVLAGGLSPRSCLQAARLRPRIIPSVTPRQ